MVKEIALYKGRFSVFDNNWDSWKGASISADIVENAFLGDYRKVSKLKRRLVESIHTLPEYILNEFNLSGNIFSLDFRSKLAQGILNANLSLGDYEELEDGFFWLRDFPSEDELVFGKDTVALCKDYDDVYNFMYIETNIEQISTDACIKLVPYDKGSVIGIKYDYCYEDDILYYEEYLDIPSK